MLFRSHTISPVNFFAAARELSPSPSRTSSAQGGWGICIIGERTSLAPRERPIRSFLSGQARRCFNVRAGLTQYLLQATKHPSFAAGGPGWTCCSLPNTPLKFFLHAQVCFFPICFRIFENGAQMELELTCSQNPSRPGA